MPAWVLSDGSRLVNPRELEPHELRLNQWVSVKGRAYRITSMRVVRLTGRLIELAGRRTPVYLAGGETLTGFDVAPPPDPAEVPPPVAVPPPARPRRKRAASGRRGG